MEMFKDRLRGTMSAGASVDEQRAVADSHESTARKVLDEAAEVIQAAGYNGGVQGGGGWLTLTIYAPDVSVAGEHRLSFRFRSTQVQAEWSGGFVRNEVFKTMLRPFSRERVEEEVLAFIEAVFPRKPGAVRAQTPRPVGYPDRHG